MLSLDGCFEYHQPCELWVSPLGVYENKKKTSWANAKVKLHFQVNFCSKKCWVQTNFSCKQFLGLNKFWVDKFCALKRF